MKRGMDSPSAVEQRLKNAEAEMAQAHLYDYIVVNDDLGRAVSELEAIIDKEYHNG
jgi:guanylate kinase